MILTIVKSLIPALIIARINDMGFLLEPQPPTPMVIPSLISDRNSSSVKTLLDTVIHISFSTRLDKIYG